ncbi:MAG: hypothetical protein IPG86_20270 [Chitinophagaceae bacterium]|nr:hypothetical protein [Chitinophagaceae bacterium]
MKKGEVVGLIILVSFVLWVIIGRCTNQNELKSGVIVNVRVVSWTTPSKGSSNGSLYGEFVYKGKKYRLLSPTTYGWGLHNLIGKTFPAMFSAKNEKIEILITPEDFKKFKIPFPDSLKWVIE